ncbi:hypothetical protein V2J09_017503, partial [Rumex salicifolius]
CLFSFLLWVNKKKLLVSEKDSLLPLHLGGFVFRPTLNQEIFGANSEAVFEEFGVIYLRSTFYKKESQLACSGCRNILLYPRGAGNVRCALCNTVTPVQPNGSEMDHLICGVCRTLLMYTRGATSVRCMCCHTVNLTPVSLMPASNQVATVRCGSCSTTLMYPFGAHSVKCAVCQYITNTGAMQRQYSSADSSQVPTASTPPPNNSTQTVVIENPMSRNESGKLVSNVVVGVTSGRK